MNIDWLVQELHSGDDKRAAKAWQKYDRWVSGTFMDTIYQDTCLSFADAPSISAENQTLLIDLAHRLIFELVQPDLLRTILNEMVWCVGNSPTIEKRIHEYNRGVAAKQTKDFRFNNAL